MFLTQTAFGQDVIDSYWEVSPPVLHGRQVNHENLELCHRRELMAELINLEELFSRGELVPRREGHEARRDPEAFRGKPGVPEGPAAGSCTMEIHTQYTVSHFVTLILRLIIIIMHSLYVLRLFTAWVCCADATHKIILNCWKVAPGTQHGRVCRPSRPSKGSAGLDTPSLRV